MPAHPIFRQGGPHPERPQFANLFRKTAETGGPGGPVSGPIGSMGGRKIDPGLDNGWLSDFLSADVPTVEWLIEPLLPRGGVVFLHGPTSVGKSPFTWALASAVADGTPFCGYPVAHAGVVLYIELDTPANLLQPRLKKLKTVPELLWMEVLHKPIDICGLTEDSKLAERLQMLQENLAPVLVIINTLRKAHEEDDKDSATPSRVYGAWRHYFPEATLLFVHHDKKMPTDKKAKVDEDQMFSGSQHWANDAQVAFHIKRMRRGVSAPVPDEDSGVSSGDDDKEYQKTPVVIRMTKSQVSDHERFPPLQMRLEPDGTNWQELGPAEYRKYFALLDWRVSKAERIEAVMEQFSIGKSAAYAACQGMR